MPDCYLVNVLYSDKFKRFYIGLSNNMENRLREHNKGQSKSTKPYAPWRLVHIEEFTNRPEARIREKYLKSAAGRKWRKMNINLGD